MADARLLPPSVADARGLAFLEVLERLGDLDLSPVLVYHLDGVPDSALYALAWQFDVLGAAGWDLADTAEKRRDLLRRAFRLHQRKGTPWAILEALRALGYPDATVVEGAPGSFRFRVHLGALQDGDTLPAELQAQLLAAVETWKNARSWLDSLDWTAADHSDALTLPQDEPMQLTQHTFSTLDGSWLLDGSRQLSGTRVDDLGTV